MAVSAGIGFFITFVGLQSSGIIAGDDATLISLGDVHSGGVLLTFAGLVITVILMTKKVPAAIFFGMIITALLGIVTGIVPMPSAIVGSVPSVAPTFGAAFEGLMDFDTIFNVQFLIVVLTFLFVDFFDTAGTLVGVASQANLIKDNKLPRASKALLADAFATITGAIFGTSTTTICRIYSRCRSWGTERIASVVTGVFLAAIFFSPLIVTFTSEVTAPALIIVGILMASNLSKISWGRFEVAVPAFLTVFMMPLTYSIATGIAIGFIFYPITMIMAGKRKEINPIM